MSGTFTKRPEQIRTPWSAEQVAALAMHQKMSNIHPYTCGNNSDHGAGALTPTTDGWICPDCDYRQVWAWNPL